ncbi:MAG: hydantoinase B/oxoprolinase family protein [Proteobacteria bacterium]|nr:hydantoinase B/oxoprolinase family protein [Pseudomonadota bacterium]
MDMVTMNIIDSTLVSICREMGLTMMKTAYSTIFNEGMDFTCGLGNTQGEMIGVAEFNPSQIGGMPLVLKTTAEEIPHESIQEGDVIVTNDPYRGGMHTPEHSFIKPVFVDGVLYGYAVAIGHVAEVGGMVPGGFAGEATEIFHEGLRVPPVKIKKAGKDVDEVWKLMLANVRTPRNNYGDYRAMISAVDVGAARLQAVIEKYGAEIFTGTVNDLMDYSETRMRAEIGEIRDGKYSFEDYMEDDGIEAKPYKIHVDVHVQGEEVVVDYSGSDHQAKGPINAVLSVAWSSAYNAILHLTDASIPKNSGCFRPIKIVAPGGSLLNCDYPATCVGGNTETHIRIAYTIIGAMAQCVPERAFATDAGTHSNFLFGAHDARSDEYVVCYDFTCAAWGGRPFADGNEAVNCINGNSRMVPIEVFEVRYPWLIEEFRLEPDSAGPGRFRGAHSVSKTFRAVGTEITVSSVSDRHTIQPWGLLGGGPGATGGLAYQDADGGEWQTFTEAFGKISPSKFSNAKIAPGARVRLTAPGAGGYGPPKERAPEMIAEDLREGWITPECALRDYGYVDDKP